MIDWNKISSDDVFTITKIVKRAFKDTMFQILIGTSNRSMMDLDMDITAVHIRNPLDLEKLLNSEDIDFFHDLYGISQRVNRRTGELGECFVPRCSFLPSDPKEVKDHVE